MRYDAIDLAKIPPPASVDVPSWDAGYASWTADLAAQATAYGATYNVGSLRSDPLGWFCRVGAYRGDVVLRTRVNDAIRAVLVPTAEGADQDNLFADFNLVRQTIVPANPVTGAAAVMEGDAAFRSRRLLAPEALSCAGPGGAYAFFAYDAHPDVKDVGVYGPEDGFVADGHVVVSVLSNVGNGYPTAQVLLAVAQRLHAWTAPDVPGYIPPSRAQLDADSIRPDTDWVEVHACLPVNFTVQAIITVPPGADALVLQQASMAAVQAYCNQQHVEGGSITCDGLIAAGRMMAADGTSPLKKFTLIQPTADIAGQPLRAPYLSSLIAFVVEVQRG